MNIQITKHTISFGLTFPSHSLVQRFWSK